MGPALSDNINQAAPTTCMNAPMSLTTLAASRLRNTGVRRARHRLGFIGVSWLAMLKVCLLRKLATAEHSRILRWVLSIKQNHEVSLKKEDLPLQIGTPEVNLDGAIRLPDHRKIHKPANA